MQTFFKQNYSQMWVTLRSDETLGLLDSDYVEDFHGVDGQVSLWNTVTDERIPVLMNVVTGVDDPTPSIPFDVFTGVVDILDLPLGIYHIQGRVRDAFSHYTILSEVETPFGDERIIPLLIKVTESDIIIDFPDVLKIQMGAEFSAPMVPSVNLLQTEINIAPVINGMPFMLSGNFVASIMNQGQFTLALKEMGEFNG